MSSETEDIKRVLAICFRMGANQTADDLERVLSFDMGWMDTDTAHDAIKALTFAGWIKDKPVNDKLHEILEKEFPAIEHENAVSTIYRRSYKKKKPRKNKIPQVSSRSCCELKTFRRTRMYLTRPSRDMLRFNQCSK